MERQNLSEQEGILRFFVSTIVTFFISFQKVLMTRLSLHVSSSVISKLVRHFVFYYPLI